MLQTTWTDLKALQEGHRRWDGIQVHQTTRAFSTHSARDGQRSHPLPHQFVRVGKGSFPQCSHRLSPVLCARSFLPVRGLIAGGWEGALPKTPSSVLLSWALPALLPTKSSWPSSTYNEKEYQSSTGFSSWPCIWTWTIPPAPHPESRRALLLDLSWPSKQGNHRSSRSPIKTLIFFLLSFQKSFWIGLFCHSV